MTKLNIEYIRLTITFVVFVFIITLLFLHINQVQLDWFETLSEVFTIPALILSIIIPIWMIIDLIRKKIADKSIFNLTFFICVISILLLLFALSFLN
ncbi:hypothetical protein [Olleya aquimaris]|uniref:Uncharacterized protein n=1 Tax=Olleya aquimaris TaxID=639310 RepID=A0A327RJV0_9FLAO|nr:hypothetical protein [Olleya aquimaris]RAJ16262.1 hypothetical protein LY08_01120 [Olleya aquimaris]